jgi:hypothetical protein
MISRRPRGETEFAARYKAVEHVIHAAEWTSRSKETLIEVWRQSLVENATVVKLDGTRYPVRRTPKRGLRQVDFVFDGNEIRGLGAEP